MAIFWQLGEKERWFLSQYIQVLGPALTYTIRGALDDSLQHIGPQFVHMLDEGRFLLCINSRISESLERGAN